MKPYNIQLQSASGSLINLEFFALNKQIVLAYVSSFCLETGATFVKFLT